MADSSPLVRPGVALAVLVVSSVLVSDRRYLRGEGAVVDAVNEWPRAVGAPLERSMVLGTLTAGLVLTAIVAVATLRVRPTLAVFLSALASWRLDDVAKELIARPRPAAVLDGLELREDIGGLGFPSGHTAMAFALAAALHPILPRRLRWVAWALAAAVGLARMYVGVHWPMDVVGGAALGVAIGGAIWLVLGGGYRRRRT
jgi:membrane-associated phospholipid phosphatase